jgi:hypothetical protein
MIGRGDQPLDEKFEGETARPGRIVDAGLRIGGLAPVDL